MRLRSAPTHNYSGRREAGLIGRPVKEDAHALFGECIHGSPLNVWAATRSRGEVSTPVVVKQPHACDCNPRRPLSNPIRAAAAAKGINRRPRRWRPCRDDPHACERLAQRKLVPNGNRDFVKLLCGRVLRQHDARSGENSGGDLTTLNDGVDLAVWLARACYYTVNADGAHRVCRVRTPFAKANHAIERNRVISVYESSTYYEDGPQSPPPPPAPSRQPTRQ